MGRDTMMPGKNSLKKVRSYCALCQSACPIVCTVEDGKLVKVSRDREHPHSTALCPKGIAGPELVYNSQRLKYPLKRTRPKGASDPGWQRISWDEALETIVFRLSEIKKTYGAHSVVFNRPGPGGSPSRDYAEWVVRLANCFGSPNTLATGHVCQWHRDTGSKYTYGWGKIPETDFENTALLLIWGHNPFSSIRCNVRDIHTARRRGAKLVVVDPRQTQMAEIADLWVQIRPGTDGALILGLIHRLIEDGTYDQAFVKEWTNAPFLVDSDSGDLLSTRNGNGSSEKKGYLVWDKTKQETAAYLPQVAGFDRSGVDPAIFGSFSARLSSGKIITVRPVFEHLRDLAASYPAQRVESITGVPVEKINRFAEYLGKIRPVSYYSYNGIEQHTNAMQTNRALCVLYALTGSLDQPGGNVVFPSFPGPKIRDPRLLPPEIHRLRIAHDEHPLGPAGNPNSSAQAYKIFDAILSDRPYPVKALAAFGGNLITANSNSLVAREALTRLEFCVQTDLFMTPTAESADIVLPASTFFEWPYVKRGFPNLLKSRQWVQYRPRVISPLLESRSDMEIIFELAVRLGLGDKFWNGDIDAAFHDQLKAVGLTMTDVKNAPEGVTVDMPMVYRKYARTDSKTGARKGFETSSGRVELFSEIFKKHGYAPLPVFEEPAVSPVSKPEWAETYPLILTCSKMLYFCHGQHRALPSLRRAVPHPYVEMHPGKAEELGVENGEWVYVETPHGKIKLKAALTQKIAVDVVCIQHGWWQSCPELDLPGYDPYSTEGANANLLYSTEAVDRISGSVPYKAYVCTIRKASPVDRRAPGPF